MLKTLDMSSGAWETEERLDVTTDPQQPLARAATLQLGLRLQEVEFTGQSVRSQPLMREETERALLH